MDLLVLLCTLLTLLVTNDARMARQWNRRVKPSEETSSKDALKDEWFNQPVDHYEPTNPSKWKQRYHVINDYYHKGGPAFLVLEGEYEVKSEYMKEHTAVAYAKKMNGIVFSLEHRFYGQSRPTSDLSVANLRYLSVDQVLADAAFFIEGMISQYELPEGTKWVVFGASYAGNLAAWLRYKFPHLVYAGVAYSAPVLAKLNFYEYDSYARDIIKKQNKECIDALKTAHSQVKDALKESNDMSDFTKKFKLCDKIDPSNKKDVGRFLEGLGSTVAGVAQDNAVEFLCEIMLNKTIGDYIDRYAEFFKIVMENQEQECMFFRYDPLVQELRNISWDMDSGSGDRQWTYQTCSELGYFQTSYQPTHFFGEDITLDYYIQQCGDIYGEQFNKQLLQHWVKRTNTIYGGKNIKATKVVYVFGKIDPWITLGITESQPEAPVFLIEGVSHGPCSSPVTDSDTEEYKSACNQVEGIVTQWCQK